MPAHIRAAAADIAPVVLLPGDPGRAERIASRLDGAVCFNRHRGLLGFTGVYRGARVAVQTTMMGAPSAAIVAEELVQLGARVLIRVGTAGALSDVVALGDLVVATASTPLDGTTAAYLNGRPYAPSASFAVVRALIAAAERAGIPHHAGPIVTDDVFYVTDHERLTLLAAFGALAVEMEASALFTVAARHRIAAGCIVTAVNAVGDYGSFDPAGLEREIDGMITVALDAAADLAPSL
jgi:purine-nucleoside phosphorylase